MKTQCLWLLALMLVTAAGCGRKERTGNDSSAGGAEQTVEIGVLYSPKTGLLVSPETAKFIGLETVEVSERVISATQRVAARVFRAGTANEPRALASAFVSAADAATLRPGLSAPATPDSPAAEVIRLERNGDLQTGMVEAILRVNDPQMTLKDGDFVTVRFASGSTNAVTVVPRAALFHTTEGDFVYAVNGESFLRTAVKRGREDSEFVEVADGLFAGDNVVMRPVMTLWMTELHNVNGGDACCLKIEPGK